MDGAAGCGRDRKNIKFIKSYKRQTIVAIHDRQLHERTRLTEGTKLLTRKIICIKIMMKRKMKEKIMHKNSKREIVASRRNKRKRNYKKGTVILDKENLSMYEKTVFLYILIISKIFYRHF